MQILSSASSLTKSQNPHFFQNRDNLENFCQEFFHKNAEESFKDWIFDPERLVTRAVQIKGLPRRAILEAIRPYFSFKSQTLPLSGGFHLPIIESFPLQVFFNPCEAFNIGKFIESQAFFRKIAFAYLDFCHFFPQGTALQFRKSLEEQQFFAMSGLDIGYHDQFYSLLASFFDSKDSSNEDFDCFVSCPIYRIYTLQNVMIGLTSPELILKRLNPSKKIKIVDITQFARRFFIQSISFHIARHQIMDGSPERFLSCLKTLCSKSTIFLKYVLRAPMETKVDFDLPIECDVLSKTFFAPNFQSAPSACTLLQAILTCFGFKVDTYARFDLTPKLAGTFVHVILVVTHPLTLQKVLIDPTFKQFLKKPITTQPDIFVCPFEELNQAIQQHASHDAKGLLKFVWDPSGYSLITENQVAEAFFSPNSKSQKMVAPLRQCIVKVGLDKECQCLSFAERKQNLLAKCVSMDKDTILEELRTLDEQGHFSFAQVLDLDRRVIDRDLLSLRAVGYAMALRESLDIPNESDTLTLYGCAGSDLSLVLLATNSKRIIMLDKIKVNPNKLSLLMQQPFSQKDQVQYCLEKLTYSGTFTNMEEIEVKILLELFALGVNLNTLKIVSSDLFNGVTLSFMWKYHRQSNEELYSVTWVNATIEQPETYPIGLKNLIKQQKISVYYQKGAFKAPQAFSKYLPTIAGGLKENGYLIISEYDANGIKHDSQPYLDSSNATFQVIEETSKMQAYKKLFVPSLAFGYFTPCIDYAPPIADYWIFTPIRKKMTNSKLP